MSLQAKMRCISNERPSYNQDGSMRVFRFTPVYDSDPHSGNFAWSQATPSGYVELNVTNQAAFDSVEPGREYLLTFEEA
jgi:hypothetical protein